LPYVSDYDSYILILRRTQSDALDDVARLHVGECALGRGGIRLIAVLDHPLRRVATQEGHHLKAQASSTR
jgi:hypothetical protein